MVSWTKKGVKAIIEARAKEEEQMAMAGKIPPGKGGSPGQPYDAPKEDPKNPYVPAPGKTPVKLAGLSDDLKINAAEHKGAQKKTKIYNKAIQGSGSEKDWLKKTGPQLPLAQVDYTSPNPKFDEHMKSTPPLTKPKERIDHLKKGVDIRKA